MFYFWDSCLNDLWVLTNFLVEGESLKDWLSSALDWFSCFFESINYPFELINYLLGLNYPLWLDPDILFLLNYLLLASFEREN